MPHLVVVGSTNIDLTFRVAHLPRPGETVPGSSLAQGFGGKGANQAVMAARLGARVTMISAVGDDATGREALANYRTQGVDISFVYIVPGPTGTAAIVVDEAARNTIVVVPGANATVSAEQVRRAEHALASANGVLAQLETPIEATLEAFRLARRHGVLTLLNPAPARALPDDLLALTDLIVPNETELAALTNLSTDRDAEVWCAAESLRRRGPSTVLVTRGEQGAFVLDGAQTHSIPSASVAAIDPTAAGDAFIGALAVRLASGQTLLSATRAACLVAALTVTRPGAQDSYPSREEIESFLAAQG